MKRWILYGANGYTGELIARAARERGLQTVLAGRNRESIGRLGQSLGFESSAFDLTDVTATRAALRGATLVLNCAGPFSATARPMLDACLAERVHYLDITGEIEIFELGQRLHAEAGRAGVLLCPGVGFDVVPTDCLAAMLAKALPDATHLALGYDSRSRVSRGTRKTMIEGLASGAKVRVNGEILSEPLGSRVREIDYGEGSKTAVAISWGDVSTAFWTTRIPNIEVYVPSSPRGVKTLRRLNRWRFLMRTQLVQNWLKRQADRAPAGPDTAQRERAPVRIWGEVRNARGAQRVGRLTTANGYTVTVEAAIRIVEDVLNKPPRAGYATPSQLMGDDFVTRLPGSTPVAWS